jgi:hypothetical protein
MSFGTRSLVAIVAKVVLAKPGAWVCIEEPETYLHPKAQLGLFHFLREEAKGKRIFVATHSTAIAASCPLSSLFIVQRDADKSTVAVTVTPKDAPEVIEQLGVKPSFSFEADAIVFVEQADHVPIFEAWAKKFDFHINVQFLDAEGAEHAALFCQHAHRVEQVCAYAGLRRLRQRQRDGQPDAQGRLWNNCNCRPSKSSRWIFPIWRDTCWSRKAIVRAFPAITLPLAELEARLDPASTLPDQKKA